MMLRLIVAAGAVIVMLAGAVPVSAQGAAAPGATAPSQSDDPKPTRGRRAKKAAKEPSVGQIAARERQKKCGLEWREAKAAGKTGSQKWPQYWSKCNARLKGNSA